MNQLIVLFLMGAVSAHADCKPAYQDKVRVLEGRTTPARATIAMNGIATLATSGTVVAIPIMAGAAGVYLASLQQRARSYKKVLKLIDNAERGWGPMLNKLFHQLDADLNLDLQNRIVREILLMNAEKQICEPVGLLEKPRVIPYLRLKHVLKKNLGL